MNYTEPELRELGIKFGENVAIHRSVEFFNPRQIKIGSNVRIDCFCILSANEPIEIENHVHVAAGVFLFGSAGIRLSEYSGLSSRVSVYSATDDYSEGYLSNPTVPDKFKKIRKGQVMIGRHVLVGSGTVIMPGVRLGTGSSIGALSFVNKSVPEYLVVSGNPLRKVGMRNKTRLLELEKAHRNENQRTNH